MTITCPCMRKLVAGGSGASIVFVFTSASLESSLKKSDATGFRRAFCVLCLAFRSTDFVKLNGTFFSAEPTEQVYYVCHVLPRALTARKFLAYPPPPTQSSELNNIEALPTQLVLQ